jgi:sodium-dependent dicarboxylate transporter 2/3/5
MTTTMIASMITSNTATTAMVIAAIAPLLHSLGKKSGVAKALLLGVPIAASTGGIATIIGSPPNAIAVGAMENAGIKIDFLEWMMYGLPVAILLTAISCFALIKYYLKDKTPLSMEFITDKATDFSKELIIHRRIVIAVLSVTILLWLTSEWHGIKVAAICAVPLVFLTLTKIISGKDVQGLPWDTLLLVAGGLSLGAALHHTGLLNYYAGKITGMGFTPLVYIFILAYLTMAFSNVMSHTATSTVLIPLGLVILTGMQKDISLIIALSASTAMLLPVSTPPNAIAYSTGMIEQKDFRLGGILIGFLGPLLIILWVRFIS